MELIFKVGKLYEFVEEKMFYYFGYDHNDIILHGSWFKGSDIDYSDVSKSTTNNWYDYQDNNENNIIERDINDYPQINVIQKIMIEKLFTGWLE